MPSSRTALPFTLDATHLARQAARHFAHVNKLDGIDDDVVLITSELVANAIRYGQPPVEVIFHHDNGVVTVDVFDGGTHPEQVARRVADNSGGRGLLIVETLANSCAIQRTSTGLRVSAIIHR